MPGRELSPQDKSDKKTISENLTNLINSHNVKRIDVSRQTGIPASTLTGYTQGLRLPTPENVEKLAKFFHVDKSAIDPRYAPKDKSDDHIDIDLDNTLYYNGKEIPDKYKKIIKELMDMDDD